MDDDDKPVFETKTDVGDYQQAKIAMRLIHRHMGVPYLHFNAQIGRLDQSKREKECSTCAELQMIGSVALGRSGAYPSISLHFCVTSDVWYIRAYETPPLPTLSGMRNREGVLKDSTTIDIALNRITTSAL